MADENEQHSIPPRERRPLPEGMARGILFEKLAQAQANATPIPPDKHGDFGGGSSRPYATTGRVIEHCSAILRRQGLTFVIGAAESSREHYAEEKSKGNATWIVDKWLTTVTADFILVDTETGESATFRCQGSSLNRDDFGINHAIQSAVRTFLPFLLHIETEEGPLKQAERPRRQEAPQQQAGPPRPQVKRIAEANAHAFKRSGDAWLMDGQVRLPSCNAQGGSHDAPMMEIPPNGRRFLCIVEGCGNYADFRPEAQEEDDEDPITKEIRQARSKTPLDIIRGETVAWLEKNRVYAWQWEAVAAYLGKDRPNPDTWQADEWERALTALKADAPKLIREALAKAAEEIPAEAYRVQHLRSLIMQPEKKVPQVVRMEAEAAAQSGWHDAVEDCIARLELREPQGEAPLGRESK